MRKMLKMSIAAAMVMGIGSVSAQADGIDIVSNVKVKGEIRARFENVEDSGTVATDATGDANAFTNRLTIGASGDLFGTDWLSAYVEMTNVSALNNNYNDGVTNPNNKSTVVDPKQTRLTQAYIDAKYGKTNVRIGRQMINLDNQRFVGAVGWRQMFQTFNAVTVTNSDVENLNLFASYITDRNTVAYEGTADSRDLLLNAKYKVMPELTATAYAYMIGTQHDTYGIALTGDVAVSDGVKVSYRAEYATQTDPSMEKSGTDNSAVDVDADYYRLGLGVNANGILAGVCYESLSGEDGVAGGDTAFKTPYATLHGQNGWADVFLGNGGSPTAGLEDMSAYVGYKAKDFGTLKVVYHDFQSEYGSTDYGTEIDAVYSNKIPGVNNLTGSIKVADFDSDNVNYADVTKFWAMLTYKFASN
ncbi:alginate export family protein [Sulfurimonas sp.]|uniref:alginate export family protein n=1 Tax=Sulfurimonas sp. TaxID=2022749 RepID=UPI0026179A00|nr:alginate export family protein [Sulfurimonas sp.]MCW8895553.1 alginate export family protein [Sulfurimonas sp.]